MQIRAFQSSDRADLARFLALAAHEDESETVLKNPNLARYIENFGRAGDAAVAAQDETTDAVIGLAWARLWTQGDHGFGWVDEATPEMTIAVAPEFRGQGIGTRLVEALMERLRETSATRLSLSVRADSPAVRLYERLGFKKLSGSERRNRTGGESFIMLAPLG